MHYVGIRNDPRANANPLRSMPVLRPAYLVFRPSARDRVVGDLRIAESYRDGWARQFAAACAELGHANAVPVQNRRCAKSWAMKKLNRVRSRMNANLRDIEKARAALLALDGDLFGGQA